jgi:restriction system protein
MATELADEGPIRGPRDFEERIAELLQREGYRTELTSYTHDGGVDIFATKGPERLAVQVKMYGGVRPVNLRQILELHGAAALNGCTGAVIATDGVLAPDAEVAATRLGIRTLIPGVAPEGSAQPATKPKTAKLELGTPSATGLMFDDIWRDSVVPLAGCVLTRSDGSINQIVSVDWGGVLRITSNGRRQKIPIEIFRWVIEQVLSSGSVTRDAINSKHEGRASSGIALILAQVPQFQVGGRPLTIWLRATGDR